jgi:hypothetical protein
MDTSQITIVVAVISGLSGFGMGLVTLILGLKKQNSEDKKLKLEEQATTSQVANQVASSLITSADTVTKLQEKMYEKFLAEGKAEIEELRMSTNQKISELVVKINEQQTTIDELKTKDENNRILVSKLIKGIRILIKQLEEQNVVPIWMPSEVDISS